jgi:REP element-mobilizing transposase RayT
MNRGVARRPLYQHREDMRAFLALAAQQVRARRIEIHAFSLMGTHFHLLVRSLEGVLREAMRQIQNRYSRWFNRKNKRDGPLFRGRYLAKLTDDPDYRRAVLRYIDTNPVEAGIVSDAEAYEFGSAFYWQRQRIPRWLSTSWIDGLLEPQRAAGLSRAQAYREGIGEGLSREKRDWLERRLRVPDRNSDEGKAFLNGTNAVIRDWMLRKIKLADNSAASSPLLPVDSVRWSLTQIAPRLASTKTRLAGSRLTTTAILETMMLRDLCGLRLRDVARLTRVSLPTAHRRCQLHQAAMEHDPDYAGLAIQAARLAANELRHAPAPDARPQAPRVSETIRMYPTPY